VASEPLPSAGRPAFGGALAGRPTGTLRIGAAAFAGAVVLAAALAYDVKAGAALIAAICFVPVALLRLQLAVCVWVVLLFFARVPGLVSIPDHLLLLIVACWAGLLVGRRAEAREALARHRRVIVPAVVFFVWVTLTLAWAPVASASSRAIKDLFYAELGFLLLLGTMVERRHVRWLLTAFVAGAALSVLYGAAKGGLGGVIGGPNQVTDPDGRFQAGSGDPNYLGAVLVPALMLAGGLAMRRPPLQRAALAVAALVIAIGLAATQSRGGLLAGLATGIVALVIWRGRRAVIAALMVFAAGVATAFFLASPEAWHRIGSSNASGSGRTDIWQVALRVADAHPYFGVGINQFPQVSPQYVSRPGALDNVGLLVDKHIVVHNLYLELWAETGIVGLGLFVLVVAMVLSATWRAAGRFDALGDLEMATLARTTLLGTVGMLVAAFFLSNVSSHQIWVLFALGPVLWSLAQRDTEAVQELDRAVLEPIEQPSRRRPRGVQPAA
jgi:O-antigen ligase